MSIFEKYLVFIFGLLLIFIISFLIILLRRKKVPVPHSPEAPITGGSISVLLDPNKNITIIPYVKNRKDVGKASNQLINLSWPYSSMELGSNVRKAMKISQTSKQSTNKEFLDALGKVSWKKFTEDKKNISVHFYDKQGIVFNISIRDEDGSYSLYSNTPDHISSPILSNEELGNILFNLYSKLLGKPLKL